MLVLVWCLGIVFESIVSGFVINVLWGWFIVPKFHLPELGIAYAIGIALLVGMFTIQRIDHDDESAGEYLVNSLTYDLAITISSLIIGWVVHLFI